MARGFAGGIIWGAALVGTGLIALSQLSPMPQEAGGTSTPVVAEGQGEAPAPETNPATAPALAPVEVPTPADVPAAEPGPATKADPQAAAPVAAAPQAAAPESAVQDATQAPALAPDGALTAPRTDGSASGLAGEGQTAPPAAADPVAEGSGSPDTASQSPTAATQDPSAVAPTAPEGQGTAATPPQASTQPQTSAPESQSAEPKAAVLAPPVPLAEAPSNASPEVLPPLPTTPSAETAPPSLAALDEALTAPPPDASPSGAALGVTEAPQDPAQAPQGQTESAAGLTEPARLPQLSQEPDPGLDPQPLPQLGAPQAEAPPEAAPAPTPTPEAAPQIVQPDDDGLPGQRVAGLPQTPGLSAKPAGTKPAGDPSVIVNDLPQIGADAAMGMEPADTSPLRAFARPFDGAEGKPLFVILLRDVGDQGLPRDQLAQLPFPVSVVIDPLAPGAAEAARAWRVAGQEVVMLANGLPQGATAADVAQSFQAMGAILPEAVAVLDPPEAGFQSDRALATLVLSEIAAEGRGLLTWDRGLNAADQIARRDGLPAALIYRELDGDNESQPVMTRYLDRAAFKAGQEGAVVVIGDTRSATVEAILGWALEGKGANVALAPVSALLLAGE